jgi:hypothetical protein
MITMSWEDFLYLEGNVNFSFLDSCQNKNSENGSHILPGYRKTMKKGNNFNGHIDLQTIVRLLTTGTRLLNKVVE